MTRPLHWREAILQPSSHYSVQVLGKLQTITGLILHLWGSFVGILSYSQLHKLYCYHSHSL